MKTAISIPDKIFRDADRLAKRLKKSRSKLYSDAMAEYLARRTDAVTAALDEFYSSYEEPKEEVAFRRAVLRRTMARNEW